MNVTVIDPKNITNYNRTDNELQTFWLFCILVAGKNSDTTSRLLSKLLNSMVEQAYADSVYSTPFEAIRHLGEDKLNEILQDNKSGQYSRIRKAIWESLSLDLRTCSRENLMNIYGVGPKTARFFLLHTREFCEEIVLDTHILRWLREKCYLVGIPNNTPQDRPTYEKLANLCKALMLKHYPGFTLAQIDLMIWTEMSGRLN